MMRFAAVLAVLVLAAFPARSQEIPNFDGTWQGTLFFDKDAFLLESSTPAAGEGVKIEIQGPVVRVFLKDKDQYVELKPGAFHIAPVFTNAVIFATDSGGDQTIGWVESWAFTVTLKDDNTMLVEFSRVVNNVQLPLSDDASKFATRGSAELKRASPQDAQPHQGRHA